MFKDYKRIIEIDLSNFNTSQVNNMYGIFSNCEFINAIEFI